MLNLNREEILSYFAAVIRSSMPLVLALLFPLTYLTSSYLTDANDDINFIRLELSGTEQLKNLRPKLIASGNSQTLDAFRIVAEDSKIILDPRLDTYYWGLLTTNLIPSMMLKFPNNMEVYADEIKYSARKLKPKCTNCRGIEIEILNFIKSLDNVHQMSQENLLATWDKALDLQIKQLNIYLADRIFNRNLVVIVTTASLLVGIFFLMYLLTKNYRDHLKTKSLAQSLEKAQSIAHIGSWDWNIKDSFFRGSDLLYDFFQVDSQANIEILTEIVKGRVHPEEREFVFETLKDCFHNQQGFDFKFRYIVPGGLIKTAHVLAEPVQDHSGELNGFSGTLQDISQQASADQKIAAATQELDQFFSLSQDMLCLIGSDLKFKRVNTSFARILGFDPAELKGRPFVEIIDPSDVTLFADEIERISTGSTTVTCEVRCKTKGNAFKVINWSLSIAPETGLIYGAGRDVTAERTREQELQQLMAAIESSALVTVADKNGKVIAANQLYCEVSGYDRSEILGKDFRILNTGLESKTVFKDLWSTLLARKPWVGEVTHRSKSGKLYTVSSVITPILNLDKTLNQYVSIHLDISGQRHSEELLREAQSIAKMGSWELNLQDGQFNWSSECYNIFEIDPTIKGKLLYDEYLKRIHKEDILQYQNALKRASVEGEDFSFFYRIYIPETNKIKYVHSIGKVGKDSSGRPLLFSGTAQDQTERTLLEKSLHDERTKAIHSAKLASLGEMSAGIAHEINNPLAIISANIPLLHKFKNDEERFSSKTQAMVRAIERISKIVNGLRKFSRTSQLMEYKPENLSEIVKECLVLTEAKSKRFSTPVEFTSAEAPIILCDGVEIEQVLVNLINNGIDAVSQLPEKWIKIEIESTDTEAIVRVVDSGKGIPLEIESKLFDPFFTTKKVGEGTGLGLSIAKGIIEQHKGSLLINRQHPNTCFEVRFQLYAKAAPIQTTAA